VDNFVDRLSKPSLHRLKTSISLICLNIKQIKNA
jgi:hypothetical protein